VAWTLIFEMFFYGMFALLILNRWLGIAAFAAWLVVILASCMQLHHERNECVERELLLRRACLLGGYGRINARWGGALLAGGIALLLALLLLNPAYNSIEDQQAYPFSLALLGLPFMLILLVGALWEQHRRLVPRKLFLLMGEASCGIYLVHSTVISAICLLSWRLAPGLLPEPVLFCLIFVAATAAGVIAH